MIEKIFKRYKVISLILFQLFIFSSVFCSFDTNKIKSGAKLSNSDLSGWIRDAIIFNKLNEIDEYKHYYPEAFADVDLSEAYYDTGVKFYQEQKKMLALKSFLSGYKISPDGYYKWNCAIFTAKILYQKGIKESALYYINRVLNNESIDPGLKEESLQLKKRISWEYISSYEGLPNQSISDIKLSGGELLVGTWSGGIARLKRGNNSIIIAPSINKGLISKQVRSIQFFKNKVWVGTYNGLCYFNKNSGRWTRERGKLGKVTVKRLKVIRNNLFAATLNNGLYYLNNKSNCWKPFFQGAQNISDFLSVGNKMYISTLDKGLFVYSGNRFINITTNYCINNLCYSDGLVWARTHGSGMFSVNDNDEIENILTVKDGLPSDYIEALVSVSNKMIIGTLDEGACVYKPLEKSFNTINIKKGLPSNDVIRIAVEKNKIWFGTLSGGIGILLTENFEDL